MARPRLLLVGGHPLMAAMFAEHLRRGECYELESVQYCDDALAGLQSQRFDLVLVLSLYVLWRRGRVPRHVEKEKWRILPVGEVHDQPAALAGGPRRNAPWARVSGKMRGRRSLSPSR